MKIITAGLFYILVFILAVLPYTFIYGIADLIAFVMNRIFGYRRKVILDNLDRSSLNISQKEKIHLVKRIYRNLSDIFLEGIKAFTMSGRQVKRRHKILNPEVLEPFFTAGKSVIIVTGHYGNWEWGAFSSSLQTPYPVLAFYKPIGNKHIDKFVRQSRAKFGTRLVSIRDTSRTFEENRPKPSLYLMAADQSPSNRERAIWADFLGRDTAFLHGPERHARINNFPVVFTAIRRKKRGFYELELSTLVEDPSALPEGEITRRYASRLQELIMEDPANWLWSHKRWKLTR